MKLLWCSVLYVYKRYRNKVDWLLAEDADNSSCIFPHSCWRIGRQSLRTMWRDLKTKWTVLLPWRRFSLSVKLIGQLWSKWAVSFSAVNHKHTFPCWLIDCMWCVHFRCWWICTSWRSWRRIASWAGSNRAPPQTRANSSAGIKGCDSSTFKWCQMKPVVFLILIIAVKLQAVFMGQSVWMKAQSMGKLGKQCQRSYQNRFSWNGRGLF